jgi:peptidyl-prolyl cis-trans isomerase C
VNQRILIFFLIGLTIFFMDQIFNQEDSNSVFISDQRINMLINSWNTQVGRNPSSDELIGLINNAIEEEILYREALKLGLDQDDIIVKRRLIQKIILLKKSSLPEPKESELVNFYQDNLDNYTSADDYSFEHLFFKKGPDAFNQANKAAIEGYKSSAGDPFYAGDQFSNHTLTQVKDIFGNGFASALSSQKEGLWSDPITSAFGIHLVYISSTNPSKLKTFKEVKDLVMQDFIAYRSDQLSQQFIDELRNEYTVAISPNFNLN